MRAVAAGSCERLRSVTGASAMRCTSSDTLIASSIAICGAIALSAGSGSASGATAPAAAASACTGGSARPSMPSSSASSRGVEPPAASAASSTRRTPPERLRDGRIRQQVLGEVEGGAELRGRLPLDDEPVEGVVGHRLDARGELDDVHQRLRALPAALTSTRAMRHTIAVGSASSGSQ